MPASKRRRLSEDTNEPENHVDSIAAGSSVEDGNQSESAAGSDSEDESMSGNESPDAEDEILEAQRNHKSKKTQKRKRRATSPSHFGAALQSLLNTDAPSAQPLSLKPSVAKKRTDDKLEVKAKKLLEGEKKEKEEKNHIRDVIGGWGGENERSLRKVAQRGGTSSKQSKGGHPDRCPTVVVKLFNAIQQTQSAAAVVQEEAKASRGSGKPTLPAPAVAPKGKGKKAVPQPSSLSKSSAGACS